MDLGIDTYLMRHALGLITGITLLLQPSCIGRYESDLFYYSYSGNILNGASPATGETIMLSPFSRSPENLDEVYRLAQEAKIETPFAVSNDEGYFAGKLPDLENTFRFREPLDWVNSPMPPILSTVWVYVLKNSEWLGLEVPLQPDDQSIVTEGERYIQLPDIYVKSDGLSLSPDPQ